MLTIGTSMVKGIRMKELNKYLTNTFAKLRSFSGAKINNEVTSDNNGIRTHNHLVRKRTLNHLAKTIQPFNFRYRACFEQGVP